MDYTSVKKSLEHGILRLAPLSPAQKRRFQELCLSLLLAGETSLRKLARQMTGASQQDSRVRQLQRLLKSPFMQASHIYSPMMRHMLKQLNMSKIHLVMDRSDVIDHRVDLLSVNLSFRKVRSLSCGNYVPQG